MRVFGLFRKDEPGSLLANVAAGGIVVMAVGIGLAQWLAGRVQSEAAAAKSPVVYSQRVRSVLDPITTGSIARAADGTRLDPCLADATIR